MWNVKEPIHAPKSRWRSPRCGGLSQIHIHIGAPRFRYFCPIRVTNTIFKCAYTKKFSTLPAKNLLQFWRSNLLMVGRLNFHTVKVNLCERTKRRNLSYPRLPVRDFITSSLIAVNCPISSTGKCPQPSVVNYAWRALRGVDLQVTTMSIHR